jgi:hypothetical protein
MLQEHNIDRIDVLVATHPHADHIDGLIGVMNSREVGRVIDSGQIHTTRTFQDFVETIESNQIPLSSVREGDSIALDPNVSIQVLNPPITLFDGAHNEDDFNNNSVAIKLTYGEFTAMFPGDGEWTNDELRKVLRGTAKDLGDKGRDDLFGYGLLNFDFPVREESVSAVSSPAGEEEEELEGKPVVSKKLAWFTFRIILQPVSS